MERMIPDRLTVLGHPQRLALFRLLMRRYPDHVPAGELAQALNLKASTLSSYLSALMQVGLVSQRRVATSLQYAVAIDAVQETVDYLLNDCCRGRVEACPSRPGAPGPRKFRVLFICSGNSARSIMAESILRHEAGDRFEAFSAGTRPYSQLNPLVVDLLRRNGHDVTPLRAKHVSEFQRPDTPTFDFVFTVCDRAANEDCPAWPGQPVTAHWGLPDPVRAEGSEAERGLAFQRCFATLANRIRLFAALPFETLDRMSLQRAVDDLARSGRESEE